MDTPATTTLLAKMTSCSRPRTVTLTASLVNGTSMIGTAALANLRRFAGDLKACCAPEGPLIRAKSVAEVESHGTASAAMHDAKGRCRPDNTNLSSMRLLSEPPLGRPGGTERATGLLPRAVLDRRREPHPLVDFLQLPFLGDFL